jgi:hypothetical protein
MSAGIASEGARPRGRRSVRRSLASIVLGFETIVVLLAALVFYGLGILSPAVALGGGAALIAVLVVTIALLRFPWAYVIGWIAQALLVATGFLNPGMFVVGAIFAALWVYSMVTGARIDKQKEIA